MQFAKPLRPGIRSGEITCSVRIWHAPRVRPGGRYRMEVGWVVVEAVTPIDLADVTGDLARRSGFAGVVDLLKIARHGAGQNVYLVTFRYEEGGSPPPSC